MTEVPKYFPEQPEAAIATYNYTDIAEGTGVIKFTGFATTVDTTITHALTTQTFYTVPQHTSTGEITTADLALKQTINFDLTPFNLPKSIKGTFYAEGTIGVGTGAGSLGSEVYVIMLIQHWDGATATTLGTAQTPSVTRTNAGAGTSMLTFCIKGTLTDRHFKKGEILRVACQIWGRKTSDGGGSGLLCHDPHNRDIADVATAANNHTDLNIYIPFKIDL